MSKSLDTRRVSFGSVEVFGSPEVCRSLDDNEAHRQYCKKRGIPLYSAAPIPVPDKSGTSPGRVFPIFGFLFSPSQNGDKAPLNPDPVDITPSSSDERGSSPSDDSCCSVQSFDTLSHTSSSNTTASLTSSSPGDVMPKSILKTSVSFKTSPYHSNDLIRAANGNGTSVPTTSSSTGLTIMGTPPSEGLFSAQLPPRPTTRRSLLHQAVHGMQQQQSTAGQEARDGEEDRQRQVEGRPSGLGADASGKEWQSKPSSNIWCSAADQPPQLLPPQQVHSPTSPPPRLQPYSTARGSTSNESKQPLLDATQRYGGTEEEEDWDDSESRQCCSVCLCLQLLCFGGEGSKRGVYVRV